MKRYIQLQTLLKKPLTASRTEFSPKKSMLSNPKAKLDKKEKIKSRKTLPGFWSVFFDGMYNSVLCMPHLDIVSGLYL